jgi:protein phosphatase
MNSAAARIPVDPAAAASPSSASGASPSIGRKPRDDEIDVWGVTHPGKVRQTNEDHFLLGSLHKRLDVRATSLPVNEQLQACDERLGFLAMVADGVGGHAAGEEASRMVLEEVTLYLSHSTTTYYQSDAQSETFVELLQDAAMRSHERLLERAEANAELQGMATTLTLYMGIWPWVYLLQVGDSRYYTYRNGVLTQVTRDQTVAQELVDQGIMTGSVAFKSRWAHVLSSAIGGKQTVPVVKRLRNEWGMIHLMCSDGLTKHVSDERIAERLASMSSAREACEGLLQDALDGGGTDNITIIVGRPIMHAAR